MVEIKYSDWVVAMNYIGSIIDHVGVDPDDVVIAQTDDSLEVDFNNGAFAFTLCVRPMK